MLENRTTRYTATNKPTPCYRTHAELCSQRSAWVNLFFDEAFRGNRVRTIVECSRTPYRCHFFHHLGHVRRCLMPQASIVRKIFFVSIISIECYSQTGRHHFLMNRSIFECFAHRSSLRIHAEKSKKPRKTVLLKVGIKLAKRLIDSGESHGRKPESIKNQCCLLVQNGLAEKEHAMTNYNTNPLVSMKEPPQEISLLYDLLLSQECTVQQYLIETLSSMKYKVWQGATPLYHKTSPYYIYGTKNNNAKVLLVAHTDTFNQSPPARLSYDDSEGGILRAYGGGIVGADDRAGVFAVLELARRHEVDVLFPAFEETGCWGVHNFCREHEVNPGYTMAIGLDRRGANDAVFYDNGASDFQHYCLRDGFVKEHGSNSDINVLGQYWSLNSVNFSIGYYNEHTPNEHLKIQEMNNTIQRLSNFLEQPLVEFEYRSISSEHSRWKIFSHKG